jgi:dipeptide/tripeptide permease
VGRVGGIMNFSNQVSGIAASTITGYLFAAHQVAWVFGIAGIYLAIGIGAYIFLLGRIEPAKRERAAPNVIL